MQEIDVVEYLRESNAIEGVHDEDALDAALEAWKYLQRIDVLTLDTIKTVHAILLGERQPNIAGEYRNVRVYIGTDTPPAPGQFETLLSELIETRPTNAVEALQWHVQFEKIHPFRDGNGRVGRLIYLWHCQELLGVPPIMWRAEDTSGYYALFETAPDPSDTTLL